jgi:hypothetical protein
MIWRNRHCNERRTGPRSPTFQCWRFACTASMKSSELKLILRQNRDISKIEVRMSPKKYGSKSRSPKQTL